MPPARAVVVGGGIAGLAAAWTLRRRAVETGRAVEVRLFEAAPRLGGKIATERHGGFLVETGPDSFVTRKPEAVELARELGLGDRLVATDERHHRVWMVRRGRLAEIPPELSHVLPCRLAPVWSSDLLSWRGKLRLALDLVLPRRRGGGDESLGAFLRRRFGHEMVDRLAGPLLAGIYVADPESLSLAATFPHLAEIERRHRSVIRGLRAAGAHHAHAPSPSSRVSLVGGVGELVEALVAALRKGGGEEERDGTAAAMKGGVRLHTACAVRRLERLADGRWRLHLADGRGESAGGGTEAPAGRPAAAVRDRGEDDAADAAASAGAEPDALAGRFAADAVVLALPAGAAAALLSPVAASVSATLAAIPHVSTATVTLGYRRADLPRPLDGFGFVVPAAEGRRITACTWSSAKFPGRAAAGDALLRVFVGGAQGERWLEGDDGALVAHARHELAELMGLAADPVLTAVHRHPAGTPQYRVGHAERIAAAEAALPAGLHLAGSAYHGIGIPDCIRSGRQAAERVLREIA